MKAEMFWESLSSSISDLQWHLEAPSAAVSPKNLLKLFQENLGLNTH